MYRFVLKLFIQLNFALLCVSPLYQHVCPHYSQKKFRQLGICNTTKPYHVCLKDTSKKDYVEKCKTNGSLEYAAPGQYLVLSGNLRNIYCEKTRYQPFELWENQDEKCFFLKSNCRDEGQVPYVIEDTIKDDACRCDYSSGYAFVIFPAHVTYCVPSEEDCSCYIKNCSKHERLSSDYQCIPRYATKPDSSCSSSSYTCNRNQTDENENFKKDKTANLLMIMIAISVIIIFLIGLIIIFINDLHSFPLLYMIYNDKFSTDHISTSDIISTNGSVDISTIDLSLCLSHDSNGGDTGSFRSSSCGSEIKIEKPSISVARTNLEVAGTSITIKCDVKSVISVTGIEWSHIKWGKEIKININANSNKFSGGSCKDPSLTIHNLTTADSGFYKCKASNEVGTSISEASSLIVTGSLASRKPIIIPASHNYILGVKKNDVVCVKKIDVVCIVLSDPETTNIFLEKNINGETTTIESKQIRILTILRSYARICFLRTYEPGTYTWCATNKFGTVHSDEISVKGFSDFRHNVKIVAAIHIGSKLCHCGFASLDSLQQSAPKGFSVGVVNKMNEPTCILLDTKNNAYIGTEARAVFQRNCILQSTEKLIWFQDLMTALNETQEAFQNVNISDESGQQLMPASKAFCLIIKYLKKKILEQIKDRKVYIKLNQILWVFPLPSTWCEEEHDFFSNCIKQAGIKIDKSLVVDESIAALSCFTRQLLLQPCKNVNTEITSVQLLIDLGEKYQISAWKEYQKDSNRELYKSNVAEYSENLLLSKLIIFLKEEIIEEEYLDQFEQLDPISYNEFITDFKLAVITQFYNKKEYVMFSIFISLLNEFYLRIHQKTFEEVLKVSRSRTDVCIYRGKLCITKSKLASVFIDYFAAVTHEIKQFAKDLKPYTVSAVMVMGSLASSVKLRTALLSSFTDTKIYFGDEPDSIILTGAILYGSLPNVINTRILPYTIGRRLPLPFREGIDDPKKKTVDSRGKHRCRDRFEWIVSKNTFVYIGKKCNMTYKTIRKGQQNVKIALYAARNKQTKYVDEKGCRKLGELIVKVPSSSESIVDVELYFEHNHIKVTATERKSEEKTMDRFLLFSE